jgi:hypothetical protein
MNLVCAVLEKNNTSLKKYLTTAELVKRGHIPDKKEAEAQEVEAARVVDVTDTQEGEKSESIPSTKDAESTLIFKWGVPTTTTDVEATTTPTTTTDVDAKPIPDDNEKESQGEGEKKVEEIEGEDEKKVEEIEGTGDKIADLLADMLPSGHPIPAFSLGEQGIVGGPKVNKYKGERQLSSFIIYC